MSLHCIILPVPQETTIDLKYKEDLKNVCHLAYKKGLLSGTEGNLSLKINDDLILVTPRNSHKGLVSENDFVIVNKDGNLISNGTKEPTSELALHLEAYKKRPDIKAVVHMHPPYAVSFSVSGTEFNQPAVPEIIVLLGEVPMVPYREPGTEKLANIASSYLEKHDAVVLERHGAVTVGKDIYSAYFKMESLEHAAKIMHLAHTQGEIKTLDDVYVEELVKQRHKVYGKEIELREGTKLFCGANKKIKLKDIFKKLTDNNSPVFQRILNLINELAFNTIQKTTYSQKLTHEEKEQLSRELTASFLGMILGRFTKKP